MVAHTVIGGQMPDFAINPPIHTTEHILRSTRQAAAFVRQFETVTSIETLQLGRMLKDVNSEGEAQLAVRALKGWLKKRGLSPEAK
jgi:hypothetical protein